MSVSNSSLGEASSDVGAFIDDMNSKYLELHKSFEDNFWATKMNTKGASSEELTRTKLAYDAFLRDKANLAAVRSFLAEDDVTEEQRKVLNCMQKTFLCYIMESPEAEELKDSITALETKLEDHRINMKLGYVDPKTQEFVAGSSVLLRTQMRTSDDEATRKACFEGADSIGRYVAEQFVEIVKARNRLAKKLGYEDFYDYKVIQAEGFNKARLFQMLDGLEEDTREIMESARAALAKESSLGDSALEPWNLGYALAGSVDKKQDPYFPFELAPAVWGKSFQKLGINYQASTMQLDLCDREKKYSNGFCHWPVAPYRKSDGSWVPAQTNFTSLASPSAVGSGVTALTTLMHEGGHAAHFANIDQGSPFFSQERAPTSVAYAENQSMFLDSLVEDAAWLAKYAMSRKGEVMPWELIEEAIKAKHPYKVFEVRAMLAVPYFEKALYELPEDQLSAESVILLAEEIEKKIQGGRASRPLMSVPHILSDESSCYYHGYVLAEMSVQQTRVHFLQKYGYLVDNAAIGKDLTEVYWKPGNGEAFLDLVERLTGSPLKADSWVSALKTPLEEKLHLERTAYDEALSSASSAGENEQDLGMRAIFVHGDEVISDSESAGGFDKACKDFQKWVQAKYQIAA